MRAVEPRAVDPVVAGPVAYRAAQQRIVDAAVGLFSEHGVGGTSLQMIADALGVTKAAVYHQFRTKDEIVLAAAEANMAPLEAALDAAEAEDGRPAALEVLLDRLIDLAIQHRQMVSMIQRDPVMIRLLSEHPPFRSLMDRLYTLLAAEGAEGDGRVPAAMLSAAINGAVFHPLVADIDDDTLRASFLDLARRLLGLTA